MPMLIRNRFHGLTVALVLAGCTAGAPAALAPAASPAAASAPTLDDGSGLGASDAAVTTAVANPTTSASPVHPSVPSVPPAVAVRPSAPPSFAPEDIVMSS